jgi:hypothetical protein
MLKPSVDRVHHDCHQDLAFVPGQEPLDESVGYSRKTERVDECERWGDLAAGAIEFVEHFAELFGERASFHLRLKMRR